MMVNYKYDISNQDALKEKFLSTEGDFPIDATFDYVVIGNSDK